MQPRLTASSTAQAQMIPIDQVGIAPGTLLATELADADIPELANTIEAAEALYPSDGPPGPQG